MIMKLMSVTAALASVVLASPYIHSPRDDAVQMNVVLQIEKDSQQFSTEAWTTDRSALLASSCSQSISSGSFATHAIAFDVDEDGSGNVTIGSSSYRVHHDPAYSGGITCTRMHSPVDAVVSCTVPAPQGVSLEPLDLGGRQECFSRGPSDLVNALMSLQGNSEILSEEAFAEKHNTTALTNLDASDLQMLVNEVDNDGGDLEKRQRQCDNIRSFTRRVGDGNPHQNPMNVQLTDEMRCDPTRECSVGANAATSYSVGWSANANAFSWISGGFSVTKTEMTGNNYGCNGKPGDHFCLWKKQGQTAYTVRNWISTPCQAASPVGDPYVMWSPNANNRRGFYYCVYGSCRARGDRWLDTDPNTPGGP